LLRAKVETNKGVRIARVHYYLNNKLKGLESDALKIIKVKK